MSAAAESNPRSVAFVFDMDGTLIDNMGAHQAAWASFLESHGVRFAPAELRRRMHGKTNPEILRDTLGAALSDAEVERLAQAKEQLYRDTFRSQIAPLPGLEAFLASVQRAGIPMAVATAAYRPNVDFVFELVPIAERFEAVVSAEHIARGKPDPEVFLRAAERLGVAPARCLAFEDSLPGLESARRAGMPVIAVATGHDTEELRRVPGVVAVIRDYQALELDALLGHVMK